MNGWVLLGFIAAAALALLWSLRVARTVWPIVAASMALAAAGYAAQGRPMLPGTAPDLATSRVMPIDPAVIELRQQMLGRFQFANSYLAIADSLSRSGNYAGAVRALTGGVRSTPDSLALWTWLGVALNQHDGGAISPAAELAFRRARTLNPAHPAPWFFQGIGYARAGEFERVRPYWTRALALSPAGSEYRPAIAERLAALDQFLAMRARMRAEGMGAPGG